MSERNTRIRASQIADIRPADITAYATNAAVDGYVPSYNESEGKWTWVANVSGASNLPDLADVDFDSGTPTDNQVLTYDAASGKWKAADAAGGYVDKIEEGDSSVEVVDAGTGYVKVKIDGTETVRFGDGTTEELLELTNEGTNHGLYLNQNGILAGNKHGLFIYSNIAQINSPLVYFHQDNPSSTADSVKIDNDGTGEGLLIFQNGILANNKHGLRVYSNEIQETSSLVKFVQNNALSTKSPLEIYNQGSGKDITDGSNGFDIVDVKDAVTQKHVQNTDTALGAQSEDLDMNTNKITGVVDPVSNQDAETKKHVADNYGTKDDTTRNELNTMLNAFRIAINGSLVQFNMVDGVTDEFVDESGIDTGASTNEGYDSSNDLYSPTSSALIELDYMEYASDGTAQAAYVSSDADIYTKLLLHMNGTDGSKTFIDETGTHTVTSVNDAQLDTGDKQFGTASLLLDGTGDYCTIPAHADFEFGTGNFTIDFWAKTTVSDEDYIFSARSGNENFRIYFIDITSSYYPAFSASSVGSGLAVDAISDTAVVVGSWVHYAIVRNGTSFKFYVNGVEKGSDTDANTMPTVSGGTVYIGRHWSDYGNFNGWIDELRISKGLARWTNNFSGSLPSSEHTIVNNLLSYSENTIIQQGSYSLKAIAAQTESLNDTLTKSGLSINLTDVDTLVFDARASRTGTQFELQIHDSGGTTTTKTVNIDSADTFQEVTWDISGVSNANKDDIDEIIIKITNADAENIIYIDDFKTVGLTNDMTLISNDTEAEVQPDNVRGVIFSEDVDSITIGTDLKFYASRDNGANWIEGTLIDEGNYESGKRILTASIDVSGQAADKTMKYKLTSLNNKDLKIHGVSLLWD